MMNPDVVEKLWDVIVIGTGIGGGTIARCLAEKGLSVLMVEKGPFGPRAEQQSLRSDVDDEHARHVRGYWPKPLHAVIDGRASLFYGPLGAGVGGSSAFYAATLERPERHDIDHVEGRSHPSGGWPESYDAFLPYFERTERMYQVCGSADPLSGEPGSSLLPAPALPHADSAMRDTFEKIGLHPYHIHLGVRFVPGCTMCFGYKCPRSCKMDGRSAGVEPALRQANAALLDDCEIKVIHGEKDSVSHLVAQRGGEVLTLRARRYVLAAGALGSPRLLLASKSEAWPQGCANSSGLVGRNLMFHLSEMVAIWPKRDALSEGPTRSIAMRDFYYAGNRRFGSFQAMGVDASYGEITHYLKNIFDRSALRRLKAIRPFLRIPAFLAARFFGRAKVFVGIIEDFPYEHNRVMLDAEDPGRLHFEYRISSELTERRRAYRKMVKRKLRGQRSMFLSFQPELNFAHCCGTLRFGNDPRTSVLDRDCRAHDVRNLYVVDASFMPTSMGINPSLTIAANALRVGDKLAAELADEKLSSDPSMECPMLLSNSNAGASGDVAVVTGAGAGLGQALAVELTRRGVRVVGFARRKAGLDDTAGRAAEGLFVPRLVDVGDGAAVQRAFTDIQRTIGNVTILVNNAAVYPHRDFMEETPESFMETVAVNLGGVVACTRAALATMTRSGAGRIVNVGSFADLAPQPASSAYSVSKGAARILTKALVADFSDRFPDIVITTWMPGIMATDMGRPDGLDPGVAARWGAELALWRDRSLNGAIFERDREILEPHSLKRRVRDRLLLRPRAVPRQLVPAG
ncbi:SDR family NAD(P)-dependent oxidoreductase [Shinella sp. NM-101]|uniref:SDR family NAD(P)-dependent oxidoreductase n=1 Tax=Shinella sp. NM-101 TaxID=2744455 RepID=UPI001F443E9E|nr:SDR family NAD(P)-dependent oxidoreductase [Shinella sp. NM-101]